METGRQAYEELERREIVKYQDVSDLIRHMGEKKYNNEEATKQGLILPYLKLLGFNYVNVNEIQPEYGIIDRGRYFTETESTSSEELTGTLVEIGKVDYLLKFESEFHLIEAKKLGKNLSKYINQLKKYFDNLDGSKLGILTDGNHYLFFTDMERKGYMDRKPFLCYGLINNFRNERVKFFSDLYKHTRFNSNYVGDKIDELDIGYINTYNNLIKELTEMKNNGMLSELEYDGMKYLLKL